MNRFIIICPLKGFFELKVTIKMRTVCYIVYELSINLIFDCISKKNNNIKNKTKYGDSVICIYI